MTSQRPTATVGKTIIWFDGPVMIEMSKDDRSGHAHLVDRDFKAGSEHFMCYFPSPETMQSFKENKICNRMLVLHPDTEKYRFTVGPDDQMMVGSVHTIEPASEFTEDELPDLGLFSSDLL